MTTEHFMPSPGLDLQFVHLYDQKRIETHWNCHFWRPTTRISFRGTPCSGMPPAIYACIVRYCQILQQKHKDWFSCYTSQHNDRPVKYPGFFMSWEAESTSVSAWPDFWLYVACTGKVVTPSKPMCKQEPDCNQDIRRNIAKYRWAQGNRQQRKQVQTHGV